MTRMILGIGLIAAAFSTPVLADRKHCDYNNFEFDNPGQYNQVIRSYTEQNPPQLNNLHEQWAEGEWEGPLVGNEGHTWQEYHEDFKESCGHVQ